MTWATAQSRAELWPQPSRIDPAAHSDEMRARSMIAAQAQVALVALIELSPEIGHKAEQSSSLLVANGRHLRCAS
jgi:hypothetical protein